MRPTLNSLQTPSLPPFACRCKTCTSAAHAARDVATALCLLLAAPAFGCVATAPLAPRLLMRRSSRLVAVAGAGAPKPATFKMSPAQAATLTVPKLKAELSELGLPTSGLKAVLLERLQAALSEPAAATAGAPAAAAAARKSAASKAAASEPRAAPTPKPLAAKRGPASPSAAAKRPKAAVPAAAGGGGGGATTQREEVGVRVRVRVRVTLTCPNPNPALT